MYKYIGIDVSKQTIDVFGIDKNDKTISTQLENSKKGFRKLLTLYGRDAYYLMEATGPYYYQLASYLYEKSVKVSVINPLIIHRFSQTLMIRAKTDKKDAEIISKYGKIHYETLMKWQPPAKEIKEMQQILTAKELLMKHKTALTNQLKAFQTTGKTEKEVKKVLNQHLKKMNESIKTLDKKLVAIAQEHYKQPKELLESIPGIGPKGAILLIVITNNFKKFVHYKQLIAYIGLSPRINQSGISVKGKGHIIKMGNSQARKQMYLSAWSAKFHNKSCVEMYQRLKEKGKPEKVIKVAIANKLIKQAFALIKSGQSYDNNYAGFNC